MKSHLPMEIVTSILYEAPTNSMPVHSPRSPYKLRGDAYCVHCGVWVWESDLQMIHGTFRHKKCGYRVRLKPVPCVQRHNREKKETGNLPDGLSKPKRHFHGKT